MLSSPKVGIALTIYKPNKKFLLAQLRSIFEQTFKNWICVLSFDSDDLDILDELDFEFINDSRFIKLPYQTQLGFKKNFQRAYNFLLSEIKPLYIAFSDQDDIWLPNKLTTFLKVSESRNENLFYSDMYLLKSSVEGDNVLKMTLTNWESRINNFNSFSDLILRNLVTGAACFAKADFISKYKDIPDYIDYHDYWFALMASRDGGLYYIDIPLGYYRQHDQNLVGMNKKSFSLNKLFKRPIERYVEGSKIVNGLINDGFHVSRFVRFSFNSKFDCGIGFILWSSHNFFKGKVLFRAPLVRGIGKIAVLFNHFSIIKK